MSLPSTCGRTVTVFKRSGGADAIEIDRHVGNLRGGGNDRNRPVALRAAGALARLLNLRNNVDRRRR